VPTLGVAPRRCGIGVAALGVGSHEVDASPARCGVLCRELDVEPSRCGLDTRVVAAEPNRCDVEWMTVDAGPRKSGVEMGTVDADMSRPAATTSKCGVADPDIDVGCLKCAIESARADAGVARCGREAAVGNSPSGQPVNVGGGYGSCIAAGGTRRGRGVRRSALRADCPAMLGPGSRRQTRFVRFALGAQTDAASQITKRAARADPGPALLGASRRAPAGPRLPRGTSCARGSATLRWRKALGDGGDGESQQRTGTSHP